jgi:A/G-specific adenine glycosylase
MWKELIDWSDKNHRDLPWRKNRTLYHTLVSEIMLQQTTVGTVKNHFERFIKKFPDLISLSKASEAEVLIAWKGLGYYRRAKNLVKISHIIHHDYGAKFPTNEEDLQKISGIGPYTSSALVAIGLDLPALAVDANIERVLARVYGLKEVKGLKLQKLIRQLFLEKKIIYPFKGSFRRLNEALMDLGRTYCQSKKIVCELCPLQKNCIAFKEQKMSSYPVQGIEKKLSESFEVDLLRVIVKGKKNNLYAYQKQDGEWLAGQFELPTFILKNTDPKLKQYPKIKKVIKYKKLPCYKTGITKYSFNNYVFVCSLQEFDALGFDKKLKLIDTNDTKSNLSTASLKAIKLTGL